MQELPNDITECLAPHTVFIFSKSYCKYCIKAKNYLDGLGVKYKSVECDKIPFSGEQQYQLRSISGTSTFPNIFIGVQSIGGCDNLLKLGKKGELKKIFDGENIQYKADPANKSA